VDGSQEEQASDEKTPCREEEEEESASAESGAMGLGCEKKSGEETIDEEEESDTIKAPRSSHQRRLSHP